MKDAGVTKHTRQAGLPLYLRSCQRGELATSDEPASSTAKRRRRSGNTRRSTSAEWSWLTRQEEMISRWQCSEAVRSIAAVGVDVAGPRFAGRSILPDRLDGSTNKIFIDKKWQRRSRSRGLGAATTEDRRGAGSATADRVDERTDHGATTTGGLRGDRKVLFPTRLPLVSCTAWGSVLEVSALQPSGYCLPGHSRPSYLRNQRPANERRVQLPRRGFLHAQVPGIAWHLQVPLSPCATTFAPHRRGLRNVRTDPTRTHDCPSPERLSRMWDAWLRLTGSGPDASSWIIRVCGHRTEDTDRCVGLDRGLFRQASAADV